MIKYERINEIINNLQNSPQKWLGVTPVLQRCAAVVDGEFGKQSQMLVFGLSDSWSENTQFLFDTTVPSRSSSLITTSYFPSILITVVGKQTETLANQAASRLRHSAFTFLGTLQPLALGGVDGGHLVGAAGRPADACAVHRSDAEVVGASHTQAVHRVFAHFHRGVVALDPVVGASLAPAGRVIRIMTSSG